MVGISPCAENGNLTHCYHLGSDSRTHSWCIGMFRIILSLVLLTLPALADPLDPRAVQVLDGDTVRVEGQPYRLVGFDAPETYRAQCPS